MVCKYWICTHTDSGLLILKICSFQHATHTSFCVTVNVLIQFAKNILYIKWEMGTLFTVNTKARGDAFHCLFPLHLRVFLRTELARMKLYDLKSAKWFPGLGGKVLMCSKLKTGLKTCRPKVGNLRSPGTGALLPRHLDIYVANSMPPFKIPVTVFAGTSLEPLGYVY